MLSDSEFTAAVIEKAKALGASVAGVADVEPVKESPSHRIYPKIGMDPQERHGRTRRKRPCTTRSSGPPTPSRLW